MKKNFMKLFAVLIAVLMPMVSFASPASELRDKAKTDGKATELTITFEPGDNLYKELSLSEDVITDLAKILKIKSYVNDKDTNTVISLNDTDVFSALTKYKNEKFLIALPELGNVVFYTDVAITSMYKNQFANQKIDKQGMTQDLSVYTGGYKSEDKEEEKFVNEFLTKCTKLEDYTEESEAHDKADKKLTYKMTKEDFDFFMNSEYFKKNSMNYADEYKNLKDINIDGVLLYTKEGNLVSMDMKITGGYEQKYTHPEEKATSELVKLDSNIVYNKKTTDKINHKIEINVLDNNDKKQNVVANIDCYDNKIEAKIEDDNQSFSINFNSVEEGNKRNAELTVVADGKKMLNALYNEEVADSIKYEFDLTVNDTNKDIHVGKINVVESFVDKKDLPDIDDSKAYNIADMSDQKVSKEVLEKVQTGAMKVFGSVLSQLPESVIRAMGIAQ